jgi:hypothetical protein
MTILLFRERGVQHDPRLRHRDVRRPHFFVWRAAGAVGDNGFCHDKNNPP